DCAGSTTNVCDTTTHACVECLMTSDCAVLGNNATCNANHQCELPCNPAQGFDRCTIVPGFYCSTVVMPPVCVQCDVDMDCDTFERCTDNRCVGTDNRPFCAPCT